mgnify:FL=1|jgi:uncharacterized damage-inducible protein DinB
MIQNILREILEQNLKTCSYTFNEIKEENLSYRLNNKTATVGFIYRHIGEIMLLYGNFFGIPSRIQNTTMGQQDEGQGKNLKESKELIKNGFKMLHQIIETTEEESWRDLIDTPFFGKVSKSKLFSHILFHNTYHAGQIGLTLKRAEGR